ncbi:hypothetical protein ZWY2020_026164 [Hordeum vulgare]|nr:hypothetical protein ZWY2020_026164 [Hordeum vulgare]
MDSRVTNMAVCNLLDGTCNKLPPLELDAYARHFYHDRRCYAVLTGADCHDDDGDEHPPPPSFYKVLIVTAGFKTQNNDQKYDLQTFSSGEESCITRRMHVHAMGVNVLGWSSCQSDAVVSHGIAHWLFRSKNDQCFFLVNLDCNEHHFSFTRLPIPMTAYSDHRPCLSLAADGTLTVLHMEKAGHRLVIWRQEESQRNVGSSGTTQWINTRTIELIQPRRKETQEITIRCILGEKCGKLLVKDRCYGRAYVADLETGAMEEVEHWSHVRPGGTPDVVLLEMDWPAFFVSRLAAAAGITS